MTPRIDAHQHFWHPARGDYGWLSADLPICRPFGPADLAPHLRNCRIDGTLLVQAAPTLGETEYLLGIADATSIVRGVVGWVDFDDPGNRATMERLGAHPKLKGFRPMIQDLPDDRWMLRTELRWAFDALEALDLVFDALVFPRHLDHLLHLLQRHPALVSVIDHGAKPNIHGHAFDDWAAAMTRLARETSTCCKLSGLATEAGPNWTVAELRPYVDHLLETFGPDRLIFGSDWPVATLATDYEDWVAAVEALTAGVSAVERAAIFGATAARVYRLSLPSTSGAGG
ncbi:MAG TPA: amidohydrolase family protein [Roseiarcus sp.]|nr:amidohydrolase family protein [Roseiarcus sp.]